MSNVVQMFPSDDFRFVADRAAEAVKGGVVIGFDEEGDMHIFRGGLSPNGIPLTDSQILWMVESFKTMLMNGELG